MTTSPLLILLVVSFPKLSETFLVNKFLGLLAQGYDAHIVCQNFQRTEWNCFPQLDDHLQKRVHPFWPRQPDWLALLLLPFALLWCLAHNPGGCWHYLRCGWRQKGVAVLKQFYLDVPLIALKPDIVHFSFGALAVEQTYLKKWLNCRLTTSFRGYDLNYVGLETKSYYQAVWNEMDGLHFLGQDLWQRAQRRGCPADKLHALIPPAIDTGFFSPPSKEAEAAERPLRILSIGRLTWVKGYEYALQAIKLLVEQGIAVEYRLVGDGPYRGPLAFLRHELGLEECVHFSGSQPPSELLGHLAWADIFLHTAVSEGFGNAVLEAQAMELPVVCSDAGGLPENVSDGQTGYVVPRRNPHALTAKLACLAHNPDLRQRLGRAGRLRVQQHFQLQDQIAAFDHFFRRVLEA
jgi:colanic acid/amylovoran biosynthesis glycosyltransferase